MNFSYIGKYPEFSSLYNYCQEADEFALSKPNISATSSRKAMEFIVKFIFTTRVGEVAYGLTSFEMITDQRFIDFINDNTLINTIHYIRKMGNVAVHDGSLTTTEALKVLEELHFLVGELFILLGLLVDYPDFIKPVMVAHGGNIHKVVEDKKIVVEQELIAKYAPKMRKAKFNVSFKRDEAENKKLFLSASLREAGWALVTHHNQAMPGCAAINMLLDDSDSVDYVLYGRDNRPLAIIEYTTTSQNLIQGRTKGVEKANKMAAKFGYKPIVYYTNGYMIYCIDQLGYKPRRVFQFHTIEELELLKLRATIRVDITSPQIDETIVNRDYQKEAITKMCQALTEMRRHSLLVMATGTGKTRVSIAAVDVLMKANWVKNVLFLADRTSLVRQAHRNFNKLLPSATTSIYTGENSDRDQNARIIFSTYQTMINLINDDTREFGIGRFDLIIIDEAHRSIFKKYGALFDYFDALMIGLTATPRNEENKSTYEVFELPEGVPDFSYELEQAIEDKYLVGFTVLDRTTEKMRRGIRYDELTDEEKINFEDAFTDIEDDEVVFSGAVIDADAFKKKIINLGTIDAMLNDLMREGLKINAGDKLGKTIIFANSHVEAEKIVERFQSVYGYLGIDFCKLIDSKVENSLNLIDNFGVRDNFPQLAVSVDMLDTGIDVPDVLNLVFFKPVRSKIKFLQMVGRGTRLSPDIFGPGLDKQGFLIFDFYDNFNYFSTKDTWSTTGINTSTRYGFSITPQSQLLNERRLSILKQLQDATNPSDFELAYRDELRQSFISAVRSLNNDDVNVQYNMAFVSKYRTAEKWDMLTDASVIEIEDHILSLIPPNKDLARVKSFDMLILVIEDLYKRLEAEGKDLYKIRHGFYNVHEAIAERMKELLKLKTIPAIVQKEQLISAMLREDYLMDDFSLEKAESVRKELRELMQYIPDKDQYYIINVSDMIIKEDEGGGIVRQKSYAEKASEYLLTSNNPSLAKIRNLDELTQAEKSDLDTVFRANLGTETEYTMWSNNAPLLPFLRTQVGIADEALKVKFGSFLNGTVLDATQLAFMNQIVAYARENGDITFMDLQKTSPFSDVDIMKVFGNNITYIKQLINGLHKPVM